MYIAEAAALCGISARLLRYYEEQGLLAPGRDTSGYRDYTNQDVELARRIRQLLGAGLSTSTIRVVLPCLQERSGRLEPLCMETVENLKREQVRIEESIEALTASRDAIRAMVGE